MIVSIKIFLFILLFFINIKQLESFDTSSIGFKVIQNNGEHIFETGNKYPNLSGLRGGSRITYNRDFQLGGLEFKKKFDNFTIEVNLLGTGWYRRTNNSRDEDFLLGTISRERGSKFSLVPLYLNDTAHTFTGTQNFADANAKSVVNEQRYIVNGRYYLSNINSNSSLKLFTTGTLRYSYYKYYLYDVIQFINNPFYYGPIGNGLSFSNGILSGGLGLGFQYTLGYIDFMSEFLLITGVSNFRDYHVQRDINFIGRGYGEGFIFNSGIKIKISETYHLSVMYEANRLYSEATFSTRGGLSTNDRLSNFFNNFHNYLSYKETNLNLGIHKIFD
jgi:hypothetical protein